MSNQNKSSKHLIQNILIKSLVHQINLMKSSYFNLSVGNISQIFEGRLVYMFYFFHLFMFSLPVFLYLLYLKYDRPEIVFLLMAWNFLFGSIIPCEIIKKQNP